MNAKDVIPKGVFTPAMGGGKERSVTYEGKACHTVGEILEYLNQDAYAYSYIYWIPQAHGGAIVILCKPNPKAFDQRNAPRIERGLEVLSETSALSEITKLFPLESQGSYFREDIDIMLARLYENGFKLCRQVDRTVKP